MIRVGKFRLVLMRAGEVQLVLLQTGEVKLVLLRAFRNTLPNDSNFSDP